jgi:hypothetical protein
MANGQSIGCRFRVTTGSPATRSSPVGHERIGGTRPSAIFRPKLEFEKGSPYGKHAQDNYASARQGAGLAELSFFRSYYPALRFLDPEIASLLLRRGERDRQVHDARTNRSALRIWPRGRYSELPEQFNRE